VTKPPRLDLWADFNNEDDDGFGWSALHHARDPALVTPGAAGHRRYRAGMGGCRNHRSR
jgi:hypothetical protein